jgi:hypothetical protein
MSVMPLHARLAVAQVHLRRQRGNLLNQARAGVPQRRESSSTIDPDLPLNPLKGVLDGIGLRELAALIEFSANQRQRLRPLDIDLLNPLTRVARHRNKAGRFGGTCRSGARNEFNSVPI